MSKTFAHICWSALGCRGHGPMMVALAWAAICTFQSAAAQSDIVYVSNEMSGDVALLDPQSGQIIDRIPVGKRPRGLKLVRNGTQLMVALSGSPIGGPGVDESKLPPADRAADGIGLVDLVTRKLVRVYPSGQDPESFDVSPDGKTLYVSNEETAEMSVLDLASGSIVTRVKIGGEPEGVAVRPDGRVVYITSEADNSVVAVDAHTLQVVARMPTPARPRSILFTADGDRAFVSAEVGGSVTLLDAKSHRVLTTIALPAGGATAPLPMGLAIAPNGRKLFVSTGRHQSMVVIDIATRSVVQEIHAIGARPWGIGVSRDGRKAFTANGSSDDVSVIDVATGKVDRRIKVGGRPWGLAVGSALPSKQESP